MKRPLRKEKAGIGRIRGCIYNRDRALEERMGEKKRKIKKQWYSALKEFQ